MTANEESNLTTLLQQQQAQLSALLSLLQLELQVLARHDATALDDLTTQKTALLNAISNTDLALSQDESLATQKNAPWFIDYIDALTDMLNACKHQTQVNQQVLDHSQLTLQRLKNDLLSAKGKSGLTYTSKGKPAVENKGSGVKA